MRVLLIFGLLMVLIADLPAQKASFSYENTALRDVIADVQKKTDYRFLYRDALISDTRISFTSGRDELFEKLQLQLEMHGLAVQVDFYRNQVLIFKRSNREFKGIIYGYVVDDDSGSRLPYATITWKIESYLHGATTNDAGFFQIHLTSAASSFRFATSYVGYETRMIEIDLADIPENISIRLKSKPLSGNEIIVEGSRYHLSSDTAWVAIRALASSISFSEPGALRSLQPLPSVSLNGAFSNGINIRGSKTDAFQLLLDGIPVYNHYHLFGIFDPFNPDALQTVGFYYNIAPAYLSAPPGGTLSFLTRTGSQNRLQGSAGISSSAFRATLEGPMAGRKGSWLAAGRNSYMNQGWFGNDNLISWGLDVDRKTETLPSQYQDIESRSVFPKSSDVQFHDYHMKFFLESSNGDSWMASVYLGSDKTSQLADRYQRGNGNQQLVLREVETASKWGTFAASVQHHKPLKGKLYMKNVAAVSFYHSEYSKDDFTYIRYNRNQQRFIPSINPFAHQNELREYKLSQQFDWLADIRRSSSFGYSLHYIETEYYEQSIQRPNYSIETGAVQLDLFAQSDLQPVSWLRLHTGLRSHYFSVGNYLRFSPRLNIQYYPHPKISITAGYSRNFQFLHSISLKNSSSAEVWITSLSTQKPSYADQFTGGVYFRPGASTLVQIEVYQKYYHNMRFHEVNPALVITRDSFLDSPWFSNSSSDARGMEFLFNQKIDRIDLSLMYALSNVQLKNEFLNNAKAFNADWDRRHQLSFLAITRLHKAFQLQTGVFYATGTPNTVYLENAINGPEPDRLENYFRIDTGIQFQYPLKTATLEATFSVFNLLNRKNPWYRTPVMVVDRSVRPIVGELKFINLDVYDLGIHPSFDIAVRF